MNIYFKGGQLDTLATKANKKIKAFPNRLDNENVEWYFKTNRKTTMDSDAGRMEVVIFKFERIMKSKYEPVNNIKIATI
jgi:hypothetical protein